MVGLVAFGCGPPLEPLRPAPRCERDPRSQPFGPWLTLRTASGSHSVVIQTANPSPPRPGPNIWHLHILELRGAPPPDHVWLRAHLPDVPSEPLLEHEATPLGNGRYTIGPFEIGRRGLWEFAFDIESGGSTERAATTHCVAYGSDEGGLDSGVPPVICETTAPTACPEGHPVYSDVERIIAEHCVVCHDGSGEEWPLSDYSHVSDWADDIRSRMLDCTMPPPESLMTMPTEERQQILEWLRCGMPR